MLLAILAGLGVDHFVLVDGGKPVDTKSYLKFLAQGKIPLADIPKLKSHEHVFNFYKSRLELH